MIITDFYIDNRNHKIIYVYNVLDLKSQIKGKKSSILIRYIDLEDSQKMGTININTAKIKDVAEFNLNFLRLQEEQIGSKQDLIQELLMAVGQDQEILQQKIEELQEAQDSLRRDMSINELAERIDGLFVIRKKSKDGLIEDVDEEIGDDIQNMIITFVMSNYEKLSIKNPESIDGFKKAIEIHLLENLDGFGEYEIDINSKQLLDMIKEMKKNDKPEL